MANTPVQFRYSPGLTLTVDLFPYGSDTAAVAALALTEQTNRDGMYLGTVTGAVSGWHTAHLKLAGSVVGVFDLWLEDTTDEYVGHDAPTQLHQGSQNNAATDNMRGTDGVDTAPMRGTDGVDTSPMRGTDNAALAVDTALEATSQAILDAVGTSGVVLTPAQVQAIALEVYTQADGIEAGWTLQETLRVIAAAAAAKVSGADTTVNTFRNLGDDKNRITATVDAVGNRTGIVYDKS